jgi:hypothetical protein|tara:strand:- start:654 stop:824 length:171 start_codon:yes stop_codon:yes gene_type:complete
MILEFKNNKYIVYDDSGKVVIISSQTRIENVLASTLNTLTFSIKDVCISHIKTIKG